MLDDDALLYPYLDRDHLLDALCVESLGGGGGRGGRAAERGGGRPAELRQGAGGVGSRKWEGEGEGVKGKGVKGKGLASGC